MSYWCDYSTKLVSRILNPRSVGGFTESEAEQKEMFLAKGKDFEKQSENAVVISLLVDKEDGVVADAKFQAYGDSALIGAADTLCELVLRKNHLQAAQISAADIEKKVGAFPGHCQGHLNLVMTALYDALEKCRHLTVQTPLTAELPTSDGPHPDWENLGREQKIDLIKKVIESEIEPYVSMDAGGVTVKGLEGDQVVLVYAGNCTSCYSAIGSTLSAIENILKAKLYPELTAIADPASLNFQTPEMY